MATHKRFWYYARNTGLAVTVLVGVITILSWVFAALKAPEKALVAEVSYGVHRIPPSMQKLLVRLSKLDSDSLLMHDLALDEILKTQEKSAESLKLMWQKQRIVWKVQGFLNAHGISPSIKYEQQGLAGYWSVLVRNTGSKQLRNVRLVLPGATEAWIDFRGLTDSIQCTASTAHIDEMQPKEQAIIFAFTQYGSPSRYDKERILLTHDEGIGKVRMLVPCGTVGQWFDSVFNRVFMLAIVVLASIVIASYFTEKSQASTLSTDSAQADNNRPSNSSDSSK
jgi:hypothetical protein